MKTILLYLVLSLFSLSLAAQSVPAQDAKLMDDYIKSHMAPGTTVVSTAAISKVFTGNFYIVSPGFTYPDGVGYCSDFNFNITGSTLVIYEMLSEDKELPVLQKLVKKEFLLKDETGAKLFEAALNELYPVKDSEKPGIKHIKKNNQWIFLRGKFFDDQTAVIVTTDTKGTITKLEVKLAYTGA